MGLLIKLGQLTTGNTGDNTVDMEDINTITSHILECAFTVHANLGPGLLESAYECIAYEMSRSGKFEFDRQLALPLVYDSIKLDMGYRVDFRIAAKVILEIKALESIHEVHVAQVLTYLKLSGCKIGLLINFNVPRLKQGIRRLIF